jgi:dienelactone hydrolase
MKYSLSLLISIVFVFSELHSQGELHREFTGEKIQFSSGDGIKVTADLYMTDNPEAPFVILFHQARYSRGEYREIAPRLNAMGFNCMAVDQRSGDQVNGVVNETHREAQKQNLGTEYWDALTDIEAAYVYVKHGLKPEKIILWGSSYSAALVFYMGSEHHDNLAGILAFSPAEYFEINGKEIKNFAARVTAPVFVTSAKDELPKWKSIYEAVRSERHSFVPEFEGKHGSKALWKDNPGHEDYWKTVSAFLESLKE